MHKLLAVIALGAAILPFVSLPAFADEEIKRPIANFDTNMGTFRIELYSDLLTWPRKISMTE